MVFKWQNILKKDLKDIIELEADLTVGKNFKSNLQKSCYLL